ncbi:Crp/Fnr family transcriptional regulator [Siphonobacter aquaeclarae]|uniref:cAMP-binding domain of CRP or a regulatory subunit of cAMP-dependent protein kinases n=1 Tax=Siphonobacter aquaeclarae TaxID=563176 RepID=A0A1G9JYZ6_9BACT|nr:Crp/Fnr family transcriptional regulator [Siphonobacter aquaeclarae]SDL42807.1 cAMP-binding domain of CRP or a regulatory subunit of cAMP-dependent protein kinases [Siphonobacter aquaeclarae]
MNGNFPVDKWAFGSPQLFDDRTHTELEDLLRTAETGLFPKGATLFREDQIADGIFYLHRGMVKKYKVDNFNKEQIIYIARSGEFVGYHAVLSGERYADTATVIEDSEVSFIRKEAFLEVLEQSKELAGRLLKALSHEYAVLANTISVFTNRPVRERLAITLIILLEKYRHMDESQSEPAINLSRNDLANLVGASRENVIRYLSEFKEDRLIRTKGRKIWILNLEGLVAMSNYQ